MSMLVFQIFCLLKGGMSWLALFWLDSVCHTEFITRKCLMLKSEQNQEDLDYLNAHTGLGEPEVQVGSLIVMMMMMMMMVHHWWSVPPLLKSWMPKFQNFWLVGRLKRSSQCEDVIFLEFSGGSFLGLPQMARPSQTHPSTRLPTKKCHHIVHFQKVKELQPQG